MLRWISEPRLQVAGVDGNCEERERSICQQGSTGSYLYNPLGKSRILTNQQYMYIYIPMFCLFRHSSGVLPNLTLSLSLSIYIYIYIYLNPPRV